MAKSRHQQKGAFFPLRAVWAWLWAPRRNPHAAEERADQRRRDKRKKSTVPAAVRSKPKAVTAAASVKSHLAFVDKSGNVRLSDGGRIVARAAKGSKAAALDAATALYDQRLAEIDRLEAALATSAASLATFEDDLSRLKQDLRDQPGLGDLDALQLRFEQLEAALAEKTQGQWHSKRDIISTMEALATAPPSGLADRIDAAMQAWTEAGSAGSVHDTVLEKRFAAALEAATQRLTLVTEQPEVLEQERQAVLDALIALLASTDHSAETPEQLRHLGEAWRRVGGEDLAEANAQFQAMTAAIERDVDSVAEAAEALRQSVEAEAGALETRLSRFVGDADALTDRRARRALEQQVAALEARGGPENRDLTQPLDRRLDDIQWRADREVERRMGEAARLAADARSQLEQAGQIPAAIDSLKDWRAVETAANAGLSGAEQALQALQALGPVARAETDSVTAELRQARKALGDARKAFFEALDESRETAGYRKRALLDRLSFPPQGATAKALDQHLESVLADWKVAGSAGREQDQALWEAFQAIRGRLRRLREEALTAERDDYGARLAEAFGRKREQVYAIEDEIRLGRMVLEQQPDPKFAKDLKRKEQRLDKLRQDLADIQRKLGKMSKTKPSRTDAAKTETDAP